MLNYKRVKEKIIEYVKYKGYITLHDCEMIGSVFGVSGSIIKRTAEVNNIKVKEK